MKNGVQLRQWNRRRKTENREAMVHSDNFIEDGMRANFFLSFAVEFIVWKSPLNSWQFNFNFVSFFSVRLHLIQHLFSLRKNVPRAAASHWPSISYTSALIITPPNGHFAYNVVYCTEHHGNKNETKTTFIMFLLNGLDKKKKKLIRKK